MNSVCSLLTLSLSFLLFIFITNLSLVFSNDNVEIVVDKNGIPLIPGISYYISPVINSGRITLGKTVDSDCSFLVLQDDEKMIFGRQVKFSLSAGIIPASLIFTNTALEIEFVYTDSCVESSKWLIFVDNVNNNKAFVGIGGPENYPQGTQILNGTFNIKKSGSENAYKFGFCTKEPPSCLDIGRYMSIAEEGGKRLTFNATEDFEVVFVAIAT